MGTKLLLGVVYHNDWIAPDLIRDLERVVKKFDDVKVVISADATNSNIHINGVENIYADKHYGSCIIPRYNIIKYADEHNIPYVYMIDRDDVYYSFLKNIEYFLKDIYNYNGVDEIFGVNCWGELPITIFTTWKTSFIKNIFEKHLIKYPSLRLFEDAYYMFNDGFTRNYIVDHRLDFEADTLNTDNASEHTTEIDYYFDYYNMHSFDNKCKLHVDNLKYVINEICNDNKREVSVNVKYLLQAILDKNKDSEYISDIDVWYYYKYFYRPYSGRPWWDTPRYKNYK